MFFVFLSSTFVHVSQKMTRIELTLAVDMVPNSQTLTKTLTHLILALNYSELLWLTVYHTKSQWFTESFWFILLTHSFIESQRLNESQQISKSHCISLTHTDSLIHTKFTLADSQWLRESQQLIMNHVDSYWITHLTDLHFTCRHAL